MPESFAPIDLSDAASGRGGLVIHGEDAGDRADYSVASAGDINGDGFDDLIIGAYVQYGAGSAKPVAGASYVVFGHAGGFPPAIDLGQVALGQGNAERDAGLSYVVFGGPFTGGPDPTLGTGADAIDGLGGRDVVSGNLSGDTLGSGSGSDRLHGIGGRELLAGGEGRDVLVGGAGADTLAGGQGEDVFRYRDAGQGGGDLVLDFASGVDAFEFAAAGFGGGLTEGLDLGATGRFTSNADGATMSAGAIGQLVYANATSPLLWDADEAGSGDAVLMATLDDAPALAPADLHIIANRKSEPKGKPAWPSISPTSPPAGAASSFVETLSSRAAPSLRPEMSTAMASTI